jgi:hypothetical protein
MSLVFVMHIKTALDSWIGDNLLVSLECEFTDGFLVIVENAFLKTYFWVKL